MSGAKGLITKTVILASGAGCLVAEDTILAIIVGSSVTRDTIPMMVARATIPAAGFRGTVTGSPPPAVPVAEPSVLVVCLKNFTCHTKHFDFLQGKLV